jgi:aminopeptidase N
VLWHEHSEGPQAAERALWNKAEEAIAADEGEEKLPVIRNRYGDVESLFDARVYEKGAWVLHMLRRHLGDDVFFRCLREYTTRFVNREVDTRDLLQVCESVSGEGLERFFDQWLHRPGHPQLEMEYTWQPEISAARVVLRQAQPIAEHELP